MNTLQLTLMKVYYFKVKKKEQDQQANRIRDDISKDFPEKITMKDFIALCMAQYSVLIPLGLLILLGYFIIVLFITKVWF